MPARDLRVNIAGDEAQLSRAFDRAEARAAKYSASVDAQATAQTKAYERGGNAVGAMADRADAAAVKHAAAMKTIGDSTIVAGRKVSSAGSSILGMVAPLDLAGAAATKLAVDFSKSMEQLHTQAGYSQASVDSLSKSVLQLAPKVGASPEELSEGLYHIASAGIPAAKAMDVLTEAAKGARIGGSSLNDTAYALVSVMKSMPKDIHSAAEAMGLMNAIVGQGDLHMQDLVAAFSTGIVPSAKAAGLGLKDVGAALDILTQRGMPAEQSATRLRMTIGLMADPSAKAATALEEIGLSQSSLATDMQKPNGLLVAVEDLKKHLEATYPVSKASALSHEQQAHAVSVYAQSLESAGVSGKKLTDQTAAYAKVLEHSGSAAVQQEQILGDAFGRARSSSTILALTENVAELHKQYEKLPSDAQAVQKLNAAWEAVQRTPTQKLSQDQQEVNVALIEMGKEILPAVLPVVKELAGAVGSLSHDFEQLSPGVKKAIVDFTLGATAIGLMSKPVGALISSFGLLAKGIGLAETGASKFAGLFGAQLEETVPAAAEAGTAAGDAYGAAFAAASEKGIADVRLGSAATADPYAPYMIPGFGKSNVAGFGPRAGVAGLGPAGITAEEQMATPLSEAAITPSLLSTLKGGLLKGGAVAGGGIIVSQLAGGLIGGRAGSAVSSIGSGASIGAGIGTVIEPGLGTAIGAALGAAPGVIKALEGPQGVTAIASNAVKGLPSFGASQARSVEAAVKQAREQESKALARLRPVTEGHGRRHVTHPRNAGEEAEAVAIKNTAGVSEGEIIGKQEASYVKSGAVLSNIDSIIATTTAKFKKLEPAARDGMFGAMMSMVQTLEKDGRLPRGAAQKFIDSLHQKFGTLGAYSKQAAATTVAEWNLMQKGASALKSADAFVGHILGAQKQIPLNAKTTSQETNRFFTAAEDELLTIVKHSTGERHKIALTAYNDLRGMSHSFYEAQRTEAETELASLNTAIKTLAGKGSHAFISEYQALLPPLKKLWQEGYVTTQEYTAKIQGIVTGELKALGVAPNAHIEAKNNKFGKGTGPGEQGNPLLTTLPEGVGHATGGVVGNWGERGRDEVPIWVGRGEAVVNHPQQPYVELGLAATKAMGMQPYGSLHELFSSVKQTHYAAGGIVAPSVSGGGNIGAMTQGALNVEAAAASRHVRELQASAPAAAGTAGFPSNPSAFYDPAQLQILDGFPVARWIVPEVEWAKAHGWSGGVTSGWRSPTAVVHGEFATAPQGHSEHQFDIYPHGAVDVSNYDQFAAVIRGYKGPHKLIQLGIDPLHFSGTGHAAGGYAGSTPEMAAEAELYKVWSALSREGALPAGARLPAITVDHSVGLSDVSPEHPNLIHLNIGAQELIAHPVKGHAAANNWAKQVLVHELAHTMQTNVHSRLEAEGGAQAWADEWAPRIYGGSYTNPGDQNYAGYVREVIKDKGWDWINHKQFGIAHGGVKGAPGMAGGGFVSTAYGPPWEGIEGSGTTATGIDLHGTGPHGTTYPHKYIVAVDPSVIPLGTEMKIWPNPFGYTGNFVAADTGGAIKGNRIDFYDWQGRTAQNAWGRRNVNVSIGGSVTGGPAKKPHVGLTLSAGEEAHVQKIAGAAAIDKSHAGQLATWAGDVGGALETGQARWAATPENLATPGGAEGATIRAEQTVKSNKDQLRYYQEELKALQGEAREWAKARDYYRKLARKVHGGAKKQALDKAASYQAKIQTAQNDAKALKGTIYSQETSIIEAGTALAMLPAEITEAAAAAVNEGNEADLGAYQAANNKVDLEERAGLLTSAQAKAAKEANANKALGGGYGALSETGVLEVKGDLKELSAATQEATSAMEAHTEALRESAKALAEFTGAANGIAQAESGSLAKSLADVVSGQIGGVNYHGRRLTPGAGSAARY